MTQTIRALAVGASLLSLAACAGTASNPPKGIAVPAAGYPAGAVWGGTRARRSALPKVRGWISPAGRRAKALLYVVNFGADEVEIFHQVGKNQQPIGTIAAGLSFPGGATVDAKGNLYVADEHQIASQWNVPMYAPGSTSPTKVYTTDLSSPTDVAVANDGTIYICNFNELQNGWVSVYPKGNPKKEYRLADFNGGAPLSVALDAAGNVYVMYDTNDTGGSAVNEYAPGAKTGTNLNLTFKWGAGIQVDRMGNVLVVQQLSPSAIFVFWPGQTQPSQTIYEPNNGAPFALALDRANDVLFADDQNANQIDDFAYPSDKYRHATAGGFQEPTGIALSPSEFKP